MSQILFYLRRLYEADRSYDNSLTHFIGYEEYQRLALLLQRTIAYNVFAHVLLSVTLSDR